MKFTLNSRKDSLDKQSLDKISNLNDSKLIRLYKTYRSKRYNLDNSLSTVRRYLTEEQIKQVNTRQHELFCIYIAFVVEIHAKRDLKIGL